MKPLVLIILDGWGHNEKNEFNAMAEAKLPNMEAIAREYPSTFISTSGASVGLPAGQMGNSEVGHLTLGSGRIIYQELTRISKAIEEGTFFKNPALNATLDKVAAKNSALHLFGLLSDGGVHSHMEHAYAVIEAAKKKGIKKVFIHAFMDGRDTPPESGKDYMSAFVKKLKQIGLGEVSTVSGRYYAMDRDNRWDRVKKAYEAIVEGKGNSGEDAVTVMERSYGNKKTDEFVEPTVIRKGGEPIGLVQDNDAIVFFNFRADRAREITKAFIEKDFTGFERKACPMLSSFMTFTEYDASFGIPAMFPPQKLTNILGEVLSGKGVKQFRVSETEKYAHVTFFFNGGVEEPFPGEERLLIPSVKDVPTYDLCPEMRAREIADAAAEKINTGKYGFVLINFANGDMVGHTGVRDAAIRACEAVDKAVGKVFDAARKNNFAVIITSDHGNVEQNVDYETNAPHTAHTTNLVPFIIADDGCKGAKLKSGKGLSDVAPTVLKVMGLDIPSEMEGEPIC